jgi:ribonuclease D
MFADAADLCLLAKKCGDVKTLRVSLATLCSKVLKRKLDKSKGIRVSGDRGNTEMSLDQKKYAALDT